MRSEGDLRGHFCKALRANDVQVQPIESGTTGLGIPDVFIRTTKASAWVELKHEHYEPRLPYKVPFRTGQYGWLKHHYTLGGISVLGLWFPSGLHLYVNEHIQEVYGNYECDLFMRSISGSAFISWIDNL